MSIHLTRISREQSVAVVDSLEPTALRLKNAFDPVSGGPSTSPVFFLHALPQSGISQAQPRPRDLDKLSLQFRPLHRLATKIGEKCGLRSEQPFPDRDYM